MSAARDSGGWIDVSRPVGPVTPVWPEDAPIGLDWTSSIDSGAGVNVGAFSGTTHAGTHADAPLHLDSGGTPIDRLPLDLFIGEADVIDLTPGMGSRAQTAPIVPADLEARHEPGAERLLFRTGCGWEPGFPTRFRSLSAEAAAWCVQRRILLVGTDAPSIDPFDSTTLDAHRTLMGGGIVVLESLDLAGIAPGRYEFVALPLRLTGADASPVRAALRRIP